MPVAHIEWPCLGLMQLQKAVQRSHNQRLDVQVHYINQDFTRFMGRDLLALLGNGSYDDYGIGDWFFRESAFPDVPGNIDAYFDYYYPQSRGFVKNI